MSAEIAKEPGHVLKMKVSGTLSQAELAGMQSAAAGVLRAGSLQIDAARQWLDAKN